MRQQETEEMFQTPGRVRARHLPQVPVQEAHERLRASLGAAGFTITGDLDLADFLNRRVDAHAEPCFLVDACHPQLARQALEVAWDGGLLAPTRLFLWQKGKGSAVATIEPQRLAGALGGPHLREVAGRIDERLDRVFERLGEPAPAAAPAPAGEAPAGGELSESDRMTLRDAVRRHLEELMEEAARTDSRSLQRELAQTIDRLEQSSRKLEAPLGAGR
jgi:uncharacterized protein (DUF302 family)